MAPPSNPLKRPLADFRESFPSYPLIIAVAADARGHPARVARDLDEASVLDDAALFLSYGPFVPQDGVFPYFQLLPNRRSANCQRPCSPLLADISKNEVECLLKF